jgi:hypothetical protein
MYFVVKNNQHDNTDVARFMLQPFQNKVAEGEIV